MARVIKRISFAAGLILVLASCKPATELAGRLSVSRRTVPFARMEADAGRGGMASRLEALRNVAVELGWPDPILPGGYLRESDEALGYVVVRSRDGGAAEKRAVWSRRDRDSYAARSVKAGYEVAAAAILHLRPYLNRMSPVPLAAASWTDAQLGEWLAWEWAAARIGTRTPRELSAVSYVSFRLAEMLVTRMQGPGSLELARWREAVRDRRTFQLLVSDLKEQVRGVSAAHPDTPDREQTLRRIERNWLSVYHDSYSKRFITNTFLDFGKGGWVSPLELETIGDDAMGWERYEAAVPQSLEDARRLLETVQGLAKP